ncbi:MAG: hypothetical protein EGQ34_07545 [Sutterella sp.]|nr:hypothetical protein [Sutterella sp.]
MVKIPWVLAYLLLKKVLLVAEKQAAESGMKGMASKTGGKEAIPFADVRCRQVLRSTALEEID